MPHTRFCLHQVDGGGGPHLFQLQIIHVCKLPGMQATRLDLQKSCVGKHQESAVKVEAGIQVDEQSSYQAFSLSQSLFSLLEQGFVNFAGISGGQKGMRKMKGDSQLIVGLVNLTTCVDFQCKKE